MKLAPLGLVLLLACTPKPSGTGGSGSPSLYTEGTRLHFQVLTTSDGTQFPYPSAFYDTKLGTQCAFVPSANGSTWTCKPTDASFDAGTSPDFVTGTLSQ